MLESHDEIRAALARVRDIADQLEPTAREALRIGVGNDGFDGRHSELVELHEKLADAMREARLLVNARAPKDLTLHAETLVSCSWYTQPARDLSLEVDSQVNNYLQELLLQVIPDAALGHRTRERNQANSRTAAEARRESRTRRDKVIQRAVAAARRGDPHASLHAIARRLARVFDVSTATIKRAAQR